MTFRVDGGSDKSRIRVCSAMKAGTSWPAHHEDNRLVGFTHLSRSYTLDIIARVESVFKFSLAGHSCTSFDWPKRVGREAVDMWTQQYTIMMTRVIPE